MALTVHAEGPVAHGPQREDTLQGRKSLDVRRNAQGDLHIDTQILAAEQHIVDDDGGGIVAGGIIHRHVGESSAVQVIGGRVGLCGLAAVIGLLVQGPDLRRSPLDRVVLRGIPARAQNILGAGILAAQHDVVADGLGNQEGQIHCRAEGHDTGFGALLGGSVFMGNDTQLAVLELKQQTHQILEPLTHRGPQQGDGLAGLTAGAVAVFVIGDEAVILSGFQLRQGAHSAPDRGACAGGVQIRIEVHDDGAVLFCDGGRTVLDVQTAVHGHHIVFPVQGNALINHRAVILCLPDEAARKFQQDFLPLHAAALQLRPIAVRILETLHMVSGIFILHHRQEAIGIVFELHFRGNMEAKGLAGDILLGGVVVIQSQLIHTVRQGAGSILCEDDRHHIGGVIDLNLGGRELHSRLAVDPEAVHTAEHQPVGAFICQHGEVLAGHIEGAQTGGEDGIRGGTGELQHRSLFHGAGAQDVAVALAQQILLHDLPGSHGGLVADIIELVMDLAILARCLGLGQKYPVELQPLPGGHIDHIHRIGFVVGAVCGVALLIQRIHSAGGVDHDANLGIIPVGDILDVGLDGEFSAVFIGALVFNTVFVLCKLQNIRGIDIHRHGIVFGNALIGVNAIVGGHGSLAAPLHLTHGEILRVSAVRGQIFGIVIVRKGKIGIRGVVKHRRSQIVPVGQYRPVGLALDTIHGGIDGVGNDPGVVRIGDGVEGLVIAVLLQGRLPLQIVASHLVIGEVLIAQRGIHQNAALHIGALAAVFHTVADQRGAVLRGAGAHQGDGLDKGQIIHSPPGVQRAVFLGDGDAVAARIFAAEDILLRLAAPSHLEGGEGGIVLVVLEDQILVVVGLIDLVAFHSPDGKAASLFRYRDLDVSVVQFKPVFGSPGMDSQSAEALQSDGGNKSRHHRKDDQEGKYSFHT